jgi:hypothetical protein
VRTDSARGAAPKWQEGRKDGLALQREQYAGVRRCRFVMPPRPVRAGLSQRAQSRQSMSATEGASTCDRIDRGALQKLVRRVQMEPSKLKAAQEALVAAEREHPTPAQILHLLSFVPSEVASVAEIPVDALASATGSGGALISFSLNDLRNYRFKIQQFVLDMRFGDGAQVRAHRAALAQTRARGSA